MELPNILSLVGAVLLVAGTTMFGRAYGNQYKERVEFLRDFQKRLEVLKNEIVFFKGVLQDSFQKAAAFQGPAQTLFAAMWDQLEEEEVADAAEAWERACEIVCKQISLTEEERETIKTLGQLLGNSDVEGQLSLMETMGGQVQMLEEKAEEARKKNQPLWQKIGPVAGAAIAIFLM